MNHSNEQLLFSQTYQNVAQLVTASYFSQVPARARHFLIETADDTAVDEATSLNQNKPDREVGSLNGLNRNLFDPKNPAHVEVRCLNKCLNSWAEKWEEKKDCEAMKNCESDCRGVSGDESLANQCGKQWK